MSTNDLPAAGKKRSGNAHVGKGRTGARMPAIAGPDVPVDQVSEYSGPLTPDSTWQRKEAELMEAKAETEFFLDLLSHDVRNMIQVSAGYVELAQQSPDLEEAKSLMAKGLSIMHDTAVIIDNVRKLQVLRHGNVERKPVNMYEVLSDLQARYMTTAIRQVTINLKAAPDSTAMANDMVTDIFSNLISNSIKHSDPEKSLIIDIRADRLKEKGVDHWKCSIEDNGPGISDLVKNVIFMRFQHGNAQAHGKGLGLHIARTLVESYGGRIWVEDRVPGDYTKGARFVVMLPAEISARLF